MIARKSFLIVVSNFLIRFIGWIGLIVIARLWGDFAPAALGIIGFAMSFLALFNLFADLGFSQAHVKRISEGKDLGTCIGTYAAIKLLLTTVMVALFFLFLFFWKYVLQQDFYDATTESVVYVFLFYYIVLNLIQIAAATFEARKEFAKKQVSQLFEGIKTPLMIVIALAGVSAVNIPAAVPWPSVLEPFRQFLSAHAVGSLATSYLISMIAVCVVSFWFLRKYPIKKPSRELMRNYFVFALPITLFSVIGIISVNIDKIMIGYFWTSTEVGYYFSVQQIIQVVMILHIAVATVLFPTFSEYFTFKHIKHITQTLQTAERYISMVMVPPIVFFMLFAGPVINIMLNSAFLPGVPVLIILSMYTFVYSLNRPYGSLLSGMNKPSIVAKIGFAICLTNIPLNILFIPRDGILSGFGISGPTGAALATLCSIFIGFFWLRWEAKKLLDIPVYQTHTLSHIIAGCCMAAGLFVLTFVFPIIRWYELLFYAGIGLGIYLGILIVIQEFKKQDFDFFLDLLRPKKLLDYVRMELKDTPKK